MSDVLSPKTFSFPFMNGILAYSDEHITCNVCAQNNKKILFKKSIDEPEWSNFLHKDGCIFCRLDVATEQDILCYNCVAYGYFTDSDKWIGCPMCDITNPENPEKRPCLNMECPGFRNGDDDDDSDNGKKNDNNNALDSYYNGLDDNVNGDDEDDEDPYEVCVKILYDNK